MTLDNATSAELMKQLGHSNFKTTLRYIDDAKEININNRNHIFNQFQAVKNAAG